jgi:hypothetical protein
VRRLNWLAEVFPVLWERLCPAGPLSTDIGLTDSQPVVLAQQSRRFKAKVARQELANSGYCPAKKLYYQGVKIHVIGDCRALHARAAIAARLAVGADPGDGHAACHAQRERGTRPVRVAVGGDAVGARDWKAPHRTSLHAHHQALRLGADLHFLARREV